MKRLAFLIESWYPHSHADVIGRRVLDGYRLGDQTHPSPLTVASVYANAPRATDLAPTLAKQYGFRVASSVADALLDDPTATRPRLAVDGILVATREDPRDQGQQPSPTPRLAIMREVFRILEATSARPPIFLDKMITARWEDSLEIVREAARLGVPLMAGSVCPYAPVDPPIPAGPGRIKVGVVIAAAPYWAFAFHATELLQGAVMEHRGRETGVTSVREVGAAYFSMVDRDRWGGRAFDAALSAARTRGGRRPGGRGNAPGLEPQGSVLLIEYVDGTRGVVALMPRAFNDSELVVGAEYDDGSVRAGSQVLQGAPFDHFNFLAHALAAFYTSGRAPVPVERSLLTTGIVLAGADSRQHGRAVAWPSLAVSYVVGK